MGIDNGQYIEDGDYTVDEDPSHQFTHHTKEAGSYTREIVAHEDESYYDQSRGTSYRDQISEYTNGSSRSSRGGRGVTPEIAAGPYTSSKSSAEHARSRGRAIAAASVGSRGRAIVSASVGSRGRAIVAASVDDTQSEFGWDDASASQYG